MSDNNKIKAEDKIQWEAPELVELDFGLEDVENGIMIGNDGMGGLATSLS